MVNKCEVKRVYMHNARFLSVGGLKVCQNDSICTPYVLSANDCTHPLLSEVSKDKMWHDEQEHMQGLRGNTHYQIESG